jgi:NAD(P)-dependent dehydrogenase (short-subunit alcohol dehydrogenase family)
MDLELHGKVAAVTGASKGIGLAVTQALVEKGRASPPPLAA